jgi:hypothetical protein
MSTPISDRRRRLLGRAGTVAFVLAVLAACSRQESAGEAPDASREPSAAVECAVNGALGFTPDCTAERLSVDGTPVLVVRHADGGFRRFEVMPEGRLVAADGTLEPAVLRSGDWLEVTIGSDRYRLDPALVDDDS